jgi:uncharacterized protein (TIGR02246 family)
MKLLMAAALLTVFTTSAGASDTAKAPTMPDQEIAKTAEAFFGAWNKHDIGAMAAFWTDDATLINPMGRLAHGRADIEKLLTDEQSTVFKNSTATVAGMKVTRALGANMAFCDGEMTVDGAQGPDGSALPQMKIHLAVIMERKGGHWMFAEARPYSFLQPPPAPTKTD